MNKRERRRQKRDSDPEVQRKRAALSAGPIPSLINVPISAVVPSGGSGLPFGNLPLIAPGNGGYGNEGGGTLNPGAPGAGGYGVPLPGAKPATGQGPASNPFIQPKSTGLTHVSQTYLSNYFVEWNLSTHRYACDQAMKQGYTLSLATLYTWTFQSSAFVQMLFEKLGDAVDEVEFYVVDQGGNRIESMQDEFVEKPWIRTLFKEIIWAYFWGFTCVNFDPLNEKIYKFPMQEIDPINHLLKSSTFAFYDGILIDECDNLLFIQHSTNEEKFLGWMQVISRYFIQMNLANKNWVQAGLRLAFPIMTVGYPQNDNSIQLDNGEPLNKYKIEAENIGANIDPSKAFIYPYTRGMDGEIQKSVEIDFADPKSGQNMYKIYSEFNDDLKNEIREMLLGGTLSSNGSKSGSGSRSLGEVHERMFKQVVKSKLKSMLPVLNEGFVPKLSKFYSGLPIVWRYDYNKTENLTFEEMENLSNVMNANGKRLTDDFFIENGIAPEMFEDAPTPPAGGMGPGGKPLKVVPDADPDVHMARPGKKKYW